MQVVVILMIASRGFRICGSGTFSTRTFFLPNQQSAFIDWPPGAGWPAIAPETEGSSWRRGLPFRRRHLAGLHDVLEAAQVARHLLVGLLAEQLRHPDPQNTAGRIVF